MLGTFRDRYAELAEIDEQKADLYKKLSEFYTRSAVAHRELNKAMTAFIGDVGNISGKIDLDVSRITDAGLKLPDEPAVKEIKDVFKTLRKDFAVDEVVDWSTFKITDRLIKEIREVEGVRHEVYDDGAGYPTIGVGHKLTTSENTSGKIHIDGEAVTWRDGLTDEQVNLLLLEDLGDAIAAVKRGVADVPLNYGQVESLISFTFNVGGGAFLKSTLLKRIKGQNFQDVPTQFRRWVHAGGKVMDGLKRRRETEIKLWLGQYA